MKKYIKLEKELKTASEWISHYLIREGYHIDYTLESFDEIDELFSEDLKVLIHNENANYIFALSAYIGNVIIKHFKGEWYVEPENITEDNSNIYIKLKNGKIVYPFQIVTDIIEKKYTLKEYIEKI